MMIQDLLIDRFPIPRYVVCDQNGSQARFLLSKLNPSTTHLSGAAQGRESPVYSPRLVLELICECQQNTVNLKVKRFSRMMCRCKSLWSI